MVMKRLFPMERIARFEDDGRLGAREIDGIANDRNGSLYEGSHVASTISGYTRNNLPVYHSLVLWYRSDWNTK